MGFLLTLCCLFVTAGGVQLEDFAIEPPTRVRTETGANVTFTCLHVGSRRQIASCRWVFMDFDAQHVSIFDGKNQTGFLRSVDSELQASAAPEVSLAENGTACQLRLQVVGPGNAGWYFCVDLKAGDVSDAAVLELSIAPGPTSSSAVRGNSTSSGPDDGDIISGPDNRTPTSSCGGYCTEQHHPYHVVIASVLGTILVLLSVSLAAATCYYRRQVRQIQREESKLDLDQIRMQSQAAALQKETELLTNSPRLVRHEERYLSS